MICLRLRNGSGRAAESGEWRVENYFCVAFLMGNKSQFAFDAVPLSPSVDFCQRKGKEISQS